ncbi:MAG: TerB family tellurite resistance protein [Maribacter sp.]|nr:TerB family tellurite resistance protein [Maribacter sp.]
MEFNLAEKLAIVKAIDEVILADGIVSSGEIKVLRQLMPILKFDAELIQEARNIDAKEGLSILSAMSESKKKTLAIILEEMANADGKVDEEEINLVLRIFSQVGIHYDQEF